MISASKLVAALSLLTIAFACKPNFEGNAVSVTVPDTAATVIEWKPQGDLVSLSTTPSLEANTKAEFLFESSGQPDNSYRIKLADKHDTVLTRTPSGDVRLAPINWDSSDRSQFFNVDCISCSPTPAACVITHSTANTCLTVGQVLHLSECQNLRPDISAQHFFMHPAV